jgi:hypothetical protein
MSDLEDPDTAPGYWPSVSDLFLTLFIISIAILAVIFYALLPKYNIASEKAVIVAVGVDMSHIREPVSRLRSTLQMAALRSSQPPGEVVNALNETCDSAITTIQKLTAENADLRKLMANFDGLDAAELQQRIKDLERQLNDKPPIIRIDEQRKEYRFESGSSLMGSAFLAGLNQNEFQRLAGEIIGRREEGRAKVDTLEIIGHTDGLPFTKVGNLDQLLPAFLAGEAPDLQALRAGSNNDLGLLRALAVKREWEIFAAAHSGNEILREISIRCYSAGQTILPDIHTSKVSGEMFTRGDPRARRIEMRLTRLNDRQE